MSTKTTEEALLESESRLKTTLDALTDGVYDYNFSTKETFVSDNFYRILGYEPGEFKVTDEKWDSMVHPDDLGSAYKLFDDYLEERIPKYEAEYRMLAKDGTYNWMLCTGKVTEYDSDGRPSRMIGILSNIHSRKQLEEGMRLALHGTSSLRGMDFLKYMAKSLTSLLSVRFTFIATFDEETKKKLRAVVIWEQDHICESFEYEIHGTPCELIYQRDEILFVEDQLYEKFPGDVYLKEHDIVSYYGVPFKDLHGRLIGHLYVMDTRPMKLDSWKASLVKLFASAVGSEVERLIEKEKLNAVNISLESSVEERTKQLEAAIDELDTFFYRASHDIRAPITAIEGIYNMLKLEGKFAENPVLKLLDKQIQKIKGLNKSIIEVGGIRSRIREFNPINVYMLVNDICGPLRSEATINLILDIDPSLSVTSDNYLLEIVLNNVIENSFGYHDMKKEEPRVIISSKEENGKPVLQIQDNGAGINTHLSKKLFTMFYRADSERSGYGLGLYKAKMAADKLGLMLEIESEEHVGTTVSIRF